MKGGRSHRLASNEPPEDWVNGSWTVDCSCGVTFDDGEEMVNCDECGVWVHTRCSRFIKGETSFSCDKCKKKKNRSDNNEETEVAQLLVELTSKTMRMDNLRRSIPSAPPRPRPAFRLWTEIPIEDRVHVQGVPGGDSSLFQGLSSVFNSTLWKCTGYVPKKFNFQYREFRCWDDEKEEGLVDARIDEENDNPADRGANVLCSLRKDKPTEMEVSLRGSVGEADCERKTSCQKEKNLENDVKKEKTHILAHAVHSSKHKEFVRSKERSGKKKSRSAEKEVDSTERECHEHEGFKDRVKDSQNMKNEVRLEIKLTESNGSCLDVSNKCEKMKDESAGKVLTAECVSEEASKNHAKIEVAMSEKVNHQNLTKTDSSPVRGAVSGFLVESNDAGRCLANNEDVNMDVDGLNHLKDENHDKELNGSPSSVTKGSQKTKPLRGDLQSDGKDNHIIQDLDSGVCMTSAQHDTTEGKTVADNDQPKGDMDLSSSPLIDEMLEHTKLLEYPATSSLPSREDKGQDGDKELEAVSRCNKNEIIDRMVSTSDEPHQHGKESEGSAEQPVSTKKASLEPKPGAKSAEEPLDTVGLNSSPRSKPDQHKVVSGIGKSSTSPTIVFSRSLGSSKNHETKWSSNTLRSTNTSKPRVKTNSCGEIKNDPPVNDLVRNDNRHDALGKTTKELPKVYSSSGSKASLTSKIPHVSTSKRVSDSKEQVLIPTSKTSTTHNVAVSSSSVEPASSLRTQSSSHVQNKTTGFGFSQKGERSSHSSSQPSSKVNHSPSMHPPAPVNSSPALSDEELALLLHQELNSSPRVPRVPRVRHGGALPQLGSPATASMLIKRSSSSGAKDQLLFSRRKREDAVRDSSRNPCELGETKKDKLPSCPDKKRQDPKFKNGSTKGEACNGSSDVVGPAKKNLLPLSSTSSAIGGSSSEANEHKSSSMRSSSRDISDDDVGVVVGPAPRTLPGLLDEIMSKGKRMSYEELCSAVLPHWHKLRKHNGERYAYTSHSQAVLDCLRNRNEWAQLVDRGPKTNSSRKRRKLDSESLPIVEGIENDFDKSNLKEVEVKYVEAQREDIPKGKRKTRKRRRLALRGRGIKDVRKKRKADAVMDGGDLGQFSQSSEEGTGSMFSEDESQDDKTGTTEASTSEDESGSML